MREIGEDLLECAVGLEAVNGVSRTKSPKAWRVDAKLRVLHQVRVQPQRDEIRFQAEQ
jgi:hypothetical protein